MLIRWGTHTATLTANVLMTPGIDPDVFSVEIAAIDQIPITADLTIGDGVNDNIIFYGCRAVAGSIEYDPAARRATFSARDRRWQWSKNDPAFGVYNRRDINEDIVGTKTSAQELAEILLDLIGETGYSVAGLPSAEYPFISWDYVNPAEALHDLCSRYDARICLGYDNKVKIWAAGSGATIEDVDRVSYSVISEIIDKPSKVVFVGGPKRYQVALSLEAVALDPSVSEYVNISSPGPSWKPSAGFTAGYERTLTGENLEAAKKTAFKAYKLPATVTLGDTTHNTADILAGWSDQLNDKITVEGEERRAAAYVYGVHGTEAAFSDPTAYHSGASDRVSVDFSQDKENGLIIFNKKVFDISGGKMIAPELTLICVFEYDRYTKNFIFSDGVDDLVETVRREDPVEEINAGGTTTNTTAAATLAQEYTENFIKQYNVADSSKVEVWPGIRQVNPDGAIDQVSLSLTPSAPLTTVSWNFEPALTIPRKERERQIDQARILRDYRSKWKGNK